ELNHLTNSFAQLKQAQTKFKSCVENVAEITPANQDKVILVPLTNSLYVPGKIKNPQHVIVDVGTGYFVQKSTTEATEHYQKKVEFVKGNLDKLQETIERKQENLNYLLEIMQVKLQSQQAGAAASASTS
ncbi:subunit of tubulin prefoldin, partial [Tulasnella sp. 418]